MLKKEEMEKDDDKLYEELLSEYDALGLTWTGLYGFSNTYGLAVRQDTAEQYGLSSYSELAAASGELVLAAIRIILSWKPGILGSAKRTVCSLRIPCRWRLH